MSINKIEIQDGSGNVYYPKTSIDSVIYSDNTSIGEKIIMLERKLIELKSQLADSINNKTGSSLTSNSTVDEMAAIINSIKTLEQATADANATASNILVDKTAYVNGTKVTGTMPEKGAFAQTLSANGTINLGSGHYDSIKITQSLNTRGATTWKPSTSAQSIPSGTYLTGTQTIQGDTNLAPQNIRAGVSIFGVGGALSVQSLGGRQYKSGTTKGFKTYESDTGNPNHYPIAYYSVKINVGFTPKVVVVKNSNGKLLSLATEGYSFYYFESPWGSGNFKHGWEEEDGPSSLNNKNICIRKIAKYSGSFSDDYSVEPLTWEAWG